MMAGITGKDTQPELAVRSFLHRKGFRFRLHCNRLPGRPDVVLPRWKVAVFVHGCFWHGHEGCRYFKIPKTREQFWSTKIKANSLRDMKAVHALSNAGWRVAVIWECALRDAPAASLDRLASFIRSDVRVEEIAART